MSAGGSSSRIENLCSSSPRNTLTCAVSPARYPFSRLSIFEAVSLRPSIATLVDRNGRTVFGVVHAGSPAEQAGIAAADEVVAIDGLKLTASNIDRRLKGYRAGDTAQVSVFRGDELHRFSIRLEEPPADTCYLELVAEADKNKEQRRVAWLTGS